DLWRAMRTYLINASDEGFIEESQDVIHRAFKWTRDHSQRIPGATHSVAYGLGPNFKRDPTWPHLTRKHDGAWFDFQVSVRETNQGLDILAYDFELRFRKTPLGPAPLEFIRLDMNHPDHDNEDEGLRSHLHLSSDDDGFVVPSAILDPFELLD